jgi:tRNA-2-methylthio-N6-dimethylallyladenosine synthase
MFKYSERPGTVAAKKLKDDVPDDIKARRLTEVINLQHELSSNSNREDVGKIYEVLVEELSKRSDQKIMGRTSGNKVIVFDGSLETYRQGSLVQVRVTDFTSATLRGKVVE